MVTKSQRELLEFLGPEYSTREIDCEIVLYRKINSRYDVEISGAARKRHPVSVYVWDVSRGTGVAAEIIEKFFDISNRIALKVILDDITKKYQNLT